MELKDYQGKALGQVKTYLEALRKWREKSDKVVAVAGPEAALDFPSKAWTESGLNDYRSRKNGLGQELPNFCLKIPTGGGKTLLAVKTIDLVSAIYRRRQTGLVLWVVPTSQIYRQTLQSLHDRDHPYRQHLDIASGGRSLILEKTDRFTPLDVAENLVVLLLMLPSANRQTKEALRVFKDNGGFSAFFPGEDKIDDHRKLLELFPNLDAFGEAGGFYGRQIKTSLGNTLRTLSPVIILDEGHKAYSETAQETLRGFNPELIVELSATPTDDSNILVDIKGAELAQEEMIKLDLHVNNKVTADWKVAMLAAKEHRDALEKKTRAYEADSGKYIRPICLVQAERTGKEQRGGRFIHSEDVRDYLVKTCGIPAEQVAVKSSEKDDIEGLDLLSRDCPVRFIITKQALQEGWDCAFAYVLAILTNPGSKNGLTQLVGRILRQPGARKTKVKELDESYVFCFQQKAEALLESVRKGFSEEGLGDLHGHIVPDESSGEKRPERVVGLRKQFQKFADKICLPVFVIKDGDGWRKVGYETDILCRIDWAAADFSELNKLPLPAPGKKNTELVVSLSSDEKEVIRQREVLRSADGGASADPVFVSRQLLDIIPNPWVAHDVAERVIKTLAARNGLPLVSANLVYIVEELRKRAEAEKDRLAEDVFRELLRKKAIRFLMFRDTPGYRLPSKLKTRKGEKLLNREDNTPLQLSLFEFVGEDSLNPPEKTVAWYLDEQKKLLWWYRNMSRQDYAVQGWKKNRIYPDFIIADANPDGSDYAKVYVVETKGVHLMNEDTDYKKSIFALCNELAEEKSWAELGYNLPEKKLRFEVVFENEWQRRLNSLFGK